jgi:predicted DNA-binding transcriptional regulator YafY
LRLLYASPWQPSSTPAAWHTVEPWSLRIHDGAWYLRAWAEDRRQPKTFRVADIQAAQDVDDGSAPASRRPPPADAWAEEKQAFGIDHDRPDVAVIRFRGAIARWVAPIAWHSAEENVWLEPGELLQRTIRYRSCRELARRLISMIDGIDSIEPAALRDEVAALGARAAAVRRRTASSTARRKKSAAKSK